MELEQKKRCSKCGKWKRFGCFHKLKCSKDGYNYFCKMCKNLYSKKLYPKYKKQKQEYAKANKHKKQKYDKYYRKTNKEKIKKAHTDWRKKNKGKQKEYYNKRKEKQKEYRKKNKENISKRMVKYRQENRDYISAREYFRYKNISAKDIPPELLQAKIEQLKLTRELKKAKKELNNGSN